jgi:hypothetical protein
VAPPPVVEFQDIALSVDPTDAETAAEFLARLRVAKACRLKAEILIAHGWQTRRARVRPHEATVASHVAQALQLDPATPASVRQLLRILG